MQMGALDPAVARQSLAADELTRLTSSLYQFMLASERSWQGAWDQRLGPLRDRAHELAHRFEQARKRAALRVDALTHGISADLRAFAREMSARSPDARRLKAQWSELGKKYEALFRQQRAARGADPAAGGGNAPYPLGHLKPRNLSRNLFHAASGIFGVMLYELWLDKGQVLAAAIAALVISLAIETLRRLSPRFNDRVVSKITALIARPHEAHRIASATWYVLGLVIGVSLFDQHAIALGVAILALADPAASLAGKAWGKRKIWGDKSWAGSAAFVLIGFAVGYALLWAVMPEMGGAHRSGVALCAALAGAAAEIFSGRLDDNLTVPLAAGAVAMLLL